MRPGAPLQQKGAYSFGVAAGKGGVRGGLSSGPAAFAGEMAEDARGGTLCFPKKGGNCRIGQEIATIMSGGGCKAAYAFA